MAMPKRTNKFQRLIASIYEKIIPIGGKVIESGMVYDKDAKELREVDILIEYEYAGHGFKIMVECRDRSRKDTVEWMDALIGKSKSLNVNKIVAVSSKGFAKSAIDKANANGIDALTLEEAKDTDWQKYPIKPRVTVLTDEVYYLKEVAYFKDGQYLSLSNIGLDSKVFLDDELGGTVKDVFEFIFLKILVPKINNYLAEKRSEVFKTRADLDKTLYVEVEETIPEIFIVTGNGDRIIVNKVKFFIEGVRTVSDLEHKDLVFNNTMVSLGEHVNPDGSKLEFEVVQEAKTKKIHVGWRREQR